MQHDTKVELAVAFALAENAKKKTAIMLLTQQNFAQEIFQTKINR